MALTHTVQSHAPFVLEAQGDNFKKLCRIMSIIWTGPTASGDWAILKDVLTGEVIWEAETGSTVTYKGIVYPFPHVGCNGFIVHSLPSGSKLLVQLAQQT